ncbi:NAD(P)H-dependent oxidoreductase [Paenibacillus xanthanilyticus]|uniref:NAD(P)H-dependent oxidoreductase n=1 Tax=Paenibacillus xanthanilyticus TaxID=1783531 RepID=A0ABV8K294_9BACL
MNTLVIVAHPDLERSVVNKRWVEELRNYPDNYTVHDLHKTYPDGRIDAKREQALIEAHGSLVLQFPIYWFNCPPLLKKWLDDVFTYGWAYGSNGGDKLRSRKIALAVSAGIKESDYRPDGKYSYSLGQILAPFELTFRYCRADYRSFFAYYGTEGEPGENVPGQEDEPANSLLDDSARRYLHFIHNL